MEAQWQGSRPEVRDTAQYIASVKVRHCSINTKTYACGYGSSISTDSSFCGD